MCRGRSDHLVFANMEADSMIPQGTQPLGFYVDESAPGPGDIKIYNAEAHLNYDGFRFDGAATAITMVNDKAYANRDGALVDNTGARRPILIVIFMRRAWRWRDRRMWSGRAGAGRRRERGTLRRIRRRRCRCIRDIRPR